MTTKSKTKALTQSPPPPAVPVRAVDTLANARSQTIKTTRMTGDELRARRMRVGLSQSELARRLSYTPAAIHAWESGKRAIPVEQLAPIRKALKEARDEQQKWRQIAARLHVSEHIGDLL